MNVNSIQFRKPGRIYFASESTRSDEAEKPKQSDVSSLSKKKQTLKAVNISTVAATVLGMLGIVFLGLKSSALQERSNQVFKNEKEQLLSPVGEDIAMVDAVEFYNPKSLEMAKLLQQSSKAYQAEKMELYKEYANHAANHLLGYAENPKEAARYLVESSGIPMGQAHIDQMAQYLETIKPLNITTSEGKRAFRVATEKLFTDVLIAYVPAEKKQEALSRMREYSEQTLLQAEKDGNLGSNLYWGCQALGILVTVAMCLLLSKSSKLSLEIEKQECEEPNPANNDSKA